MNREFQTLVKHLIGLAREDEPLTKTNLPQQFRPSRGENYSIARNLNAAFLLLLAGETHPLYGEALTYLQKLEDHPSWRETVSFYRQGLQLVNEEISQQYSSNESFRRKMAELNSALNDSTKPSGGPAIIEQIRGVLFPEGKSLETPEDRQARISSLREKRTVEITDFNPSPISEPLKEVLFTSNILLTVPSVDLEKLSLKSSLKRALETIAREEQSYWYDHPIPVGIDPKHNEALYGMEGLEEAVRFEVKRGEAETDSTLTCVLSASVTHKGLSGIVKDYLEEEFRKEKNIRHLNLYLFTEDDTARLVDQILIPAAKKYDLAGDYQLLYQTIGVNGEYGRHYSFLKAIAAFWRILIDPRIKATFKIDLDQVFPQQRLVTESGTSAFQHFQTPAWGAAATDSQGRSIELGMIAGALVNSGDIDRSLYSPDVTFPDQEPAGEEVVFWSRLPQALSTEAEMMTRYGENSFAGGRRAIQRIHVTGGTTGILVEALRKYRPFTPSFIGRAEDQAYLLSVLFSGSPHLRYLHQDGLIMRHDKQLVAKDVIRASSIGKMVGEYVRTLLFSFYVKALPWPFAKIKEEIDPFTGCFVSSVPWTVTYLRFALQVATLFKSDNREGSRSGHELVRIGVSRLKGLVGQLHGQPDTLVDQYRQERSSWNLFYDVLDKLEEDLKKNEPFAVDLRRRAVACVDECRLDLGSGR